MTSKLFHTTLLALILCSFAALAQEGKPKLQVYKNERFGIQFKYMPGFVITDKSTDDGMNVDLVFKDMSEVYTIKMLPDAGTTDMKEIAKMVYNFFKSSDSANSKLTGYNMSALNETASGYTFLEKFSINGIAHNNVVMMKSLPLGKSQGVMTRVQCEDKYFNTVTQVAAMLFATIHPLGSQ